MRPNERDLKQIFGSSLVQLTRIRFFNASAYYLSNRRASKDFSEVGYFRSEKVLQHPLGLQRPISYFLGVNEMLYH
jgi:hypothetical protein